MCLRMLWEGKRKKWLRMWRGKNKAQDKSPEQDFSPHVTSLSTRNLSDGSIWKSRCCILPCRPRSIWRHVSSEDGIKVVSYPPKQFKSVTQLNYWYLHVVWTTTRDWQLSLSRCRRFKPSVMYKFDVITELISMEVYERHNWGRLTWQAVTIALEIQAVVRYF